RRNEFSQTRVNDLAHTLRKNEKEKMAVPRVAARAAERSCRAGAARGDDQGRAAPTPSSLPDVRSSHRMTSGNFRSEVPPYEPTRRRATDRLFPPCVAANLPPNISQVVPYEEAILLPPGSDVRIFPSDSGACERSAASAETHTVKDTDCVCLRG